MKKILEKYDLIKVSGLLILLCVVLTWVVPYGYFQSEMVIGEISRMGLTELMQACLDSIRYFAEYVTFLFVLGGFYQILSKTAGYQTLINNLGKKFKGIEQPIILVVSAIIAMLTSLSNECFAILVIIPFIIAILNKTKCNKLVAMSTTFGAILVGILGSTANAKISGIFTSSFIDSYSSVRWILLGLGYVILNVFTIMELNRTRNKEHESYDMFEGKLEENTKCSVLPYAIMLSLIFITSILAYLPWSSWNVTVFSKMTDWFNKLSLFGEPIVKYVFSEFKVFGSWELSTMAYVLLFATLLIHWFAKLSWSETFEEYGKGFKKVSYAVAVLVAIYVVVILSIRPTSYEYLPTVPVIVDKIAKLSSGFNVVLAFIGALITSVFTVEPQYIMSFVTPYFASNYGSNLDILAIIFQTAYGLVTFIAPSSAILMVGLAFTGISYREWFKYIWKFLVAMFIVIVIILTIMQLAVLV